MTDDGIPLAGTWAWIWDQRALDVGTEQMVRRAVALGLDGLLVRAWNGETACTPDGWDFLEQYRRYVEAADGQDLRIAPWTYVYGPRQGNSPRREAETFAAAVLPLEPPCLVVDLEAEYKGLGAQQRELLATLADLVGRWKLAACTYDLPAYHGGADGMDYAGISAQVGALVPMVYWADRTVRGSEAVDRSRRQLRAAGVTVPVRPAVQGHTTVTGVEVEAAWSRAEGGISVWRVGADHDVARIMPAVWAALARINDARGRLGKPALAPDPVRRLLNAEHWWGEHIRAMPADDPVRRRYERLWHLIFREQRYVTADDAARAFLEVEG